MLPVANKASAVQKPTVEFEFDELFLSNNPVESDFEDSPPASIDDDPEPLPEDPIVEPDADGNFAVNYDDAKKKVNLEDFEMQYVIGKGAYGKVVLVKNKETGKLYAMKILKKDFLVETKNVTYTRTERDILRRVRHPFIVSLHFAFQTAGKVYLVMDFLNGGQLLFHLRKETMFSEEVVRFYSAEVLLALEHLHSIGVIHRDLKPENILLDEDGHLALTDFGLAKENMEPDGRTRTFCGTVEYMAPEMIQGQGYGRSADFWSLGVLVYDMLTGNPPFQHKNDQKLREKILKDKIKLPAFLTAEAHSIIKALLNRDPKKRLGSGPKGATEIKQHPFFKSVRWDKLYNRESRPPYRPEIKKSGAKVDVVSCFDEEYIQEKVLDSPSTATALPEDLFKGFSYVRSPTTVTAGLNAARLSDSVGSAGSDGNLAASLSPP